MAKNPDRTLLDCIDEAQAEGRPGVLLVGNVDDRMVDRTGCRPTLAIPYAILHHLADQGYQTAIVSLSGGITPMVPPGVDLGPSPIPRLEPCDRPADLLRQLTPILRSDEHRVAILIRHASHFAPCSSGLGAGSLDPGTVAACEILYEWSVDAALTQSFIVLCDVQDQLNELLRHHASGYKLIRAGYPPCPDREAFVRACLETRNRYGPLADDLDPGTLARITGGLQLIEIQALLRAAHARGEPLSREAVRAERAAKISERLKDLAEVQEPTIGWEDVAGLPHVKDHFQAVAQSARRGAVGIQGSTLLAGIPGVGKSHTARALAREIGAPIIFVRNLHHGLVGGSEAKVERLVETCAAFDGAVCVFEEVDQLLGRRDGGRSTDSGTTERVRGRLMEFMGGSYPVHFVGLTNRCDLLDVANADRFGVLIPVLHPSEREVAELLPVIARQIDRGLAGDVQCEQIARLPNLRLTTVRGLVDIMRMAARRADAEAGRLGTEISQRHLEQVARMYQPKHDPIEHEFLALTAIAGCQFAAYLPWMSWDGLRKEAEIPPYLKGIVDPEDGSVDQAKLHARLEELRALRRGRGRS